MNGYELSHAFFEWSFENPEKVSPNHAAIYFFAIEHCNRLGWKNKFGFPTQMTMDAIGIKKHHTYIRYFNELVEWGFFKLVQRSSNQYSANIISLDIAMPKKGIALGKATVKHAARQPAKQTETIGQSTGCIDKPLTIEPINLEPLTILLKKEPKKYSKKKKAILFEGDFEERKKQFIDQAYEYIGKFSKEMIDKFIRHWTEESTDKTQMRFEIVVEVKKTWSMGGRLATWKDRSDQFELKNGNSGKTGNSNTTGVRQTGTNKIGTDYDEKL